MESLTTPVVFDTDKGEEVLRRCGQCKQLKPLSEYGKEMGSPGLKKTKCKVCLNANGKTGRQAKRIMGDSPPIGYRCLCGKLYDGKPRGRSWVPDHDHDNGMPRNWLCRECNTNFGKIKDNPKACLNMAIYLIRWGKYLSNKDVAEFLLYLADAQKQAKSLIISPLSGSG